MSLNQLLQRRLRDKGAVRVGLIGAGKFGSMFLSQVPTSEGLEVSMIADLDPQRARDVCTAAGWEPERMACIRFIDDGGALIASDGVDVVVEATGHPAAGVTHARRAIAEGKDIVMVNVEADVLAGPLLAREAAAAGIVYSMAYGDQPALTCELVDWGRLCDFEVVAAGKGTRYLPVYHTSTPATVWDYYGLTAAQAEAARMSSQMFNSFLDGTKSAIEMSAVANATGLMPAPGGLTFPPCGTDDLPQVLRPAEEGGLLHHKGQVEVVSSLERDGRPVLRDLRWGVYVVFEAPNAYAAGCFRQYGLVTDDSGLYAAMYKPYHLIGLELNVSILSVALRREPTGCMTDFCGDVVATAKRQLSAGEVLDGEGGYTVWGRLMTARDSLALGGLPIGLAHGATLKRDIAAGSPVCWQDVTLPDTSEALEARQSMERAFREEWCLPDVPAEAT